MKMSPIWIFIIFFFYKHQVVMGSSPCKKDHYIIKKNGSISCLGCSTCPFGEGLSPPCGSELIHPPENIQCNPCEVGKTFSNDHTASSCRKCELCSLNEIVTKQCTVESDTICSGKCYAGYYYENNTYGCLPCSHCCGDENDVRILACKSMGLKQCSFLNSPKCTPAPPLTTKATTIAMTITTTTIAKTSETSMQWNDKKTIAVAIALTLAVIIILVIYFYRRHKHKKRKQMLNNQAHNGDVENGDHPLIPQCGFSKVQFDLRIQNYNGPEGPTKQVPEESPLLIELFLQNENENDFKKCKLEYSWKKDGTCIKYEEGKQLQANNLKVSDSGIYECCVLCSKHEQHRGCKMKIHVQPKPGFVYKYLDDTSLEVKERIALLLTPKTAGVGNWLNVGNHYGMDPDQLKTLEDDSDRSIKVLDYILAAYPTLTVFDFCEFLKTQHQMKLVKELENQLTCSERASGNESMNDTRDSGIDFLEDHCSLRVAIPNNTSLDNTEDLTSQEPSPDSKPETEPLDEIRSEVLEEQCNLQVVLPENTSAVSTESLSSIETTPDSKHETVQTNLNRTENLPTKNSPDSKLLSVPHSVPHHVVRGMRANPSYSDSSREGSLDDLNSSLLPTFSLKTRSSSDTSQGGKKKRKSSFNRQVSKDSQKSAGSASIQSMKNAIKEKFTKTKNDNYLEQEDTDDSLV